MIAILSTTLFIIDFVITGFATVYIWNNVICRMFDLRTFTFWEGCIFSLVITYFIPRKKDKYEGLCDFILTDILYTLFVWFLTFIAIKFISF